MGYQIIPVITQIKTVKILSDLHGLHSTRPHRYMRSSLDIQHTQTTHGRTRGEKTGLPNYIRGTSLEVRYPEAFNSSEAAHILQTSILCRFPDRTGLADYLHG